MVVFRPGALSAARSQAALSAEECRFLRSQLDAVSADAAHCARAREARVVRAEAAAQAAEAQALRAERQVLELRAERDRMAARLAGRERSSAVSAVDPGVLARAIVAEFARHRSGLPLGEDQSHAAVGSLVGGIFGGTLCASWPSPVSMDRSTDDCLIMEPWLNGDELAASGSYPSVHAEDLLGLKNPTSSFDPLSSTHTDLEATPWPLIVPDVVGNSFDEFDEQHQPIPKFGSQRPSYIETNTPSLLHFASIDASPNAGDLNAVFRCEAGMSKLLSDVRFDNDAMWGSWQANPSSATLLPVGDGQPPFSVDDSLGLLYTVPTYAGPSQSTSTLFEL